VILVDLTACPECGHPAEVEWRAVLESTDGPVEHARVRCVHGHWFFLPVEWLDTCRSPTGRVPVGTAVDGE
jgi:hypothetical protein